MASRDRRRLLVNFVYCPPVGHVIEALHYCHGYHRASPEVTVAVVLNARSPLELAGLCPFIEASYPVSLDVFDPQTPIGGLEAIPPGWDWVVDDARSRQEQQRAVFPGIAAYYDGADERFAAAGAHIGAAGAPPPAYSPAAEFRLAVPGPARARARELLTAGGGSRRWPFIAVLPAGSGPRSDYPSLRSWKLLLSAFAARWPGAGFCLLGKLRADTRTSTSFPTAELDQFRALPGVVDAVDWGPGRPAGGRRSLRPAGLPAHGLCHGRPGGGHTVAGDLGQPLARVLLQRGALLLGAAGHPPLPGVPPVRPRPRTGRRRRVPLA